MTEIHRKNMCASVRTRLLNIARRTDRTFQEVIIRYVVERFITRLSASPYRNKFILKGAMLFFVWKLDNKRTTMDLDLLGIGKSDPEQISDIFKQVCEISTEDDGLFFDKNSIAIVPIRENANYEGVRAVIQVYLGTMPIRLQVDIGSGDAVVPSPLLLEFPALLDKHGPFIRTYSPETMIAEKFNIIVQLGMANSRMKDYFDIWTLSRTLSFNGAQLRAAIESTFARRQSAIPASVPVGLSDEFSQNELKYSQWQGFVKKRQQMEILPGLREIVAEARAFLLPVSESISGAISTPALWTPGTGWQSGTANT